MHLYKRGKTWWLEYVCNGVKHRSSCHTRDKKVAKRWMDAIDTSRRMPTIDEAIRVLRVLYAEEPKVGTQIDSAWEIYLSIAQSVGRANVQSETMRQKRIHFNGFVEWLKKNAATITTVEAVSGAIAARYAAYLKDTGAKSKTRLNRISNLSNVWSMLTKSSSEITNVWTGLRPTDDDSERIRAFDPAQERKVLEAAKEVGKSWYEVCVVGRNTGLRYEDCALLQRGEVSFEDRVIRLSPRKTKRHGTYVAIPMVDELYNVLKAMPDTGDYFFPIHAHYYGNNSQKRQKVLAFRHVLEKAGLYGQGFTFHSWRHTAATKLASVGASKDTRKAILGHTTDAMAEHYDHDEHLAEKRKALEAAAGITGPSSR